MSNGIVEQFKSPEIIIGMFKPDQDEVDQKIYEGIVEFNIDQKIQVENLSSEDGVPIIFSGTNSQRSESVATSDNSNTDSDSDGPKYD